MKQQDRSLEPNSFSDTVQIVANFVQQEIVRATKYQQLYYHTLDHALAVKRRAEQIFRQIEPILLNEEAQDPQELARLENLLSLCALAHDMVQQFTENPEPQIPRKRIPGISETATFNKLNQYIQQLNQTLEQQNCHCSLLFSDRDLAILQEGIIATVCQRDPQAGKASYSFSAYSIYQPYLYQDHYSTTSLIAKIIALADLGTLGMEGVENYIKEGILVFLEDNLDLKSLILQGEIPPVDLRANTKIRLLSMTRFMVSLAEERKARFELEITGFSSQACQILREQIFVYLNSETIEQIKNMIPTNEQTTLQELIDFFCLTKNT